MGPKSFSFSSKRANQKLFPGGCRQNLPRVALGDDLVPDFIYSAVRADEKCAADDAEKGFAEEFFHAAHAVRFDGPEIRIAEKIEVELVFGLEGSLSLDGVAARTEDDDTELIELLFCVTKLGRFDGSTGSIGLRKEKKHDAFVAKIGERDVGAGVVFKAECGGFVAFFQHGLCGLRNFSGLLDKDYAGH
jgi:hypothetical protein